MTGALTLADASPAERDAVNRLLARPASRGSAVVVSLPYLEEMLRAAGICPTLRAAVEELTEPVVNLRAERATIERQWEELFAAAVKRLGSRPELERWLAQLRASGLLRRYGLADADRLLSQALTVLRSLPAPDVPLAELAASTVGDAHALDPDTSLGTIVLRAASALAGSAMPADANSRRDVWASVGVICDELSSAVLVLNLRASGETPTSRALRIYADAGEPAFLTVRQILRSGAPFALEEGTAAVYVCENPSVVAAAARRLGSASAPLVCIEGQPRTATRLLLNRLRQGGITLWYHGDFDWPGIQIANTILDRHQALPWRMGIADYRAAATGPLALSGTPVIAHWDSDLTPGMLEMGWALHEEQVTDTLLADLTAAVTAAGANRS